MLIKEHEPRTPSESLVFEVSEDGPIAGRFEAYFEAVEDSKAELVDGRNISVVKLHNAADQLIRAKPMLNEVYDQNNNLIAEIRAGDKYERGDGDADD